MAISGNLTLRARLHMFGVQLGICRFNLLVECEMQYVALQCAKDTGILHLFIEFHMTLKSSKHCLMWISFILSKQVLSLSNSTPQSTMGNWPSMKYYDHDSMTSPNSGQIIIIISFRKLACKRIWKFQTYTDTLYGTFCGDLASRCNTMKYTVDNYKSIE